MISVIEFVLSLLSVSLNAAQVKGLAPEIIAAISAAIAELEKVRGSDVTYQQLEGLRVKPTF